MKKIITQETLDKVLNCMVQGIYPNLTYLYVNQLIQELAKLPEQKVAKLKALPKKKE